MASSASDAAPRRPVRGYIDGCWDIMHSGHYNAIRQAKALCDVLVVGVHTDAVIAENKAMPVMRQAERYALLDHIKWADEILPDVPYSPEIATLDQAHADFCVHGDDMPVNAQGVCAYQEMIDAGRLRIIKRMEGVSTTDLIGRLLTLSRHQHKPSCEGAPSEGVRVTAASVVDVFGLPVVPSQAMSVSSSSRTAAPAAAAEHALGIADDIAARYGVPAAESALLRQAIAAVARAASAASEPSLTAALVACPAAKRPRLEAPAEVAADEEAEGRLRTTAPVQLLTSTRRITEFSSARQPREGDRIVYVAGSFDMFHVGHAQFLKDARELGTFLFVGIHDDLAVSAVKGAHYPVMTLNERVLNVCACKWVDEVIIGAPRIVTADLIKTWNIQVVVRGIGHLRDEALEPRAAADDQYEVPRRLGIYREVESKWPSLCHDTVVQRIIRDRQAYISRNRDRAAREDDYYTRKDTGTSPLEV